MKTLILLSLVTVLTSCGHRYFKTQTFNEIFEQRADQKSDTLIVQHMECTACLDLYITKGRLTVPLDLRNEIRKASLKDIKVCGDFPLDLIDMTSFNFKPGLEFEIVGRIIAIDNDNAIGNVPLFYVQSWRRL